jgi:outer membrane autotransporter protein
MVAIRTIRLGGGWMSEPQAQGVYQLLGLDEGNQVAVTVKFGNIQSLAGRVGARLANTWNTDGALITAWLRPNLWHEFLGDPKTSFSSATGFIPFRADLGGSWAELNGGVSAQVTRNTSIFANASYQAGLDGRQDRRQDQLVIRPRLVLTEAVLRRGWRYDKRSS